MKSLSLQALATAAVLLAVPAYRVKAQNTATPKLAGPPTIIERVTGACSNGSILAASWKVTVREIDGLPPIKVEALRKAERNAKGSYEGMLQINVDATPWNDVPLYKGYAALNIVKPIISTQIDAAMKECQAMAKNSPGMEIIPILSNNYTVYLKTSAPTKPDVQ